MRYVIVGNGVAGVTAALTLREREQRAEITLIGGESEYFFSRTALMYSFMDQIPRRGLEPYERKIYDVQNIRRVFDWVDSIDPDRRELHLRTGLTIPYDRLLLATGSVPCRIAWPGLDGIREGAVHFVSLQDLDACERLISSTKRAVVVGGGLIAIELVECLRFHRLEVTCLVKEPWFWPATLNNEESAIITAHLSEQGVDIRFGEDVREIHADATGRVSAVHTSRDALIKCQMLGIATDVEPAVAWLRGGPVALNRGILADSAFRTNVAGIFAAGDCAEIQPHEGPPFLEQLWHSAKRQGRLAALSMHGDAIDYRPPIFFHSAKFFEIEYTTVGQVNDMPPGARSHFYALRKKHACIRIVEHGSRVIGFNMLGCRWNHELLQQWISDRRTFDYVAEHIHEAQFDVEFGRVHIPALVRHS